MIVPAEAAQLQSLTNSRRIITLPILPALSFLQPCLALQYRIVNIERHEANKVPPPKSVVKLVRRSLHGHCSHHRAVKVSADQGSPGTSDGTIGHHIRFLR